MKQLVADDQRRQEAEDIAQGAAGEGDQALRMAGLVDGGGERGGRLLGLAVGDQLQDVYKRQYVGLSMLRRTATPSQMISMVRPSASARSRSASVRAS